jgi:hypothetical protein
MFTLVAGIPYTKITGTITSANKITRCNVSLFMKLSHYHIQRKKKRLYIAR